jgi:S-DNA-T family DNA segregation ATPase FtsK/SpoIIIE
MLLLEALAAGTAVVVAAPPRSHLAATARQHHLQLFQPRDGATEVADVARSRRTVLLVDDSEAFADTEAGEALCSLVRRAPDHLAVVAAARSDELAMTYRGVAVEARRSRCAVLLQPVPVDGELVGVRLPRRRTLPVPGRGVLIGDVIRSELADGSPMPVQIALP